MSIQVENLLRGVAGMFFLIALCYLFSNNRRAINWKLVLFGVVAQIAFAIGVLSGGKYNFFRILIEWLSQKFVEIINISHKGTEFIFGSLADPNGSWAYIFAVQVLPNIIFFAALSALLYYLGI